MIDPEDLVRWCSVPASELSGHPDLRIPVEILTTPEDVHLKIAKEMFDELAANEAAEVDTKWILPCGPMGQYPAFADLVNSSELRLDRLHVFHMDDFLDWQARPLADTHPYSMRGAMLREFYGRLNWQHTIPEANRHFPDVYRPDALSESIAAAGGVDTAWGGIGYRGHVAFNEPPRQPWSAITVKDFAESKTRIVVLNEDTLVAMSQRSAGGCYQVIPPLGLTIGMADLLAAKRVRLFSVTGAWKQAVVRVAAFGSPTVDYPVTLFSEHPAASLLVDFHTAEPPLVGFGV